VGLARALSLPPSRDEHHSSILTSYRVRQGVLHNPRSDRRTTQGIFHVAEGGLPIPDDKKAVPTVVFARLARARLAAAGGVIAPALHRGGSRAGRVLRVAFPPAGRRARRAGFHAGARDGNPFLRARLAGRDSISLKASSQRR